MAAIFAFKRTDLCINNEKFRLEGGMQANMIGDGLVQTLLNTSLLMHDMFQVGIQLAHMRLHDFNKQRLFIRVMVINTGRLNASHTSNLSKRCSMITILSKKLYSGYQDLFSY